MADGTTTVPIQITQAPHVLTAISAVMKAMAKDGIAKSRDNKQQQYKFRGIDDVYNALSSALSTAQLVVLPKVLARETSERKANSGGALFVVNVTMEFRFLSAIDGTDVTVGPFCGEAMDSGDKATNKAMSAAYKYMAMQTFCIPTEGDNDADSTTHEVAAREQPDDTDAKLVEFKGECLGRIAKSDSTEALNKLWAKIQDGAGFKLMDERRQRDANAIRTAVENRRKELSILEDEVPY